MTEKYREPMTTRMMTIDQGCVYSGMGKTTFRKWANEIGAARKFSERMTRYDRRVIDAALDKMTAEDDGGNDDTDSSGRHEHGKSPPKTAK